MRRHKFVGSFDENESKKFLGYNSDDGTTTKFYQIASFPDPNTGRYHIRRYVVNGKNEFSSIIEHYITKRKYEKFIASKKKHEYNMYSVYDLDVVGPPKLTEILMAKSEILANNSDYSGFANF